MRMRAGYVCWLRAWRARMSAALVAYLLCVGAAASMAAQNAH